MAKLEARYHCRVLMATMDGARTPVVSSLLVIALEEQRGCLACLVSRGGDVHGHFFATSESDDDCENVLHLSRHVR